MKIGIIVFAYNRSWHLKQVLEGLKNTSGVDKLYMFQDGLKCEAHRKEWEATTEVINNITWCEKIYELSPVNKGLAKSIVYGVNKAFKENDAVIVLEDDCVPSPNFVDFMKQCFEKYKENKQVYSVSGYSWPIELPESENDIYFCGRISSWGWGTWKNRWEQYEIDNMVIRELKSSKESSENLATWGNDLEQVLISNMQGVSDSWALYWASLVIKNKGVCINPYRSLIKNIGMDDSGVHSGVTSKFDVLLDNEDSKVIKFPKEIKNLSSTKRAFSSLFGSYSVIDNEITDEKTIIYGLGNFYFLNEKSLNERFNIVAFIDKAKQGWFAGKKILKPMEIVNIQFDKILIVVQSIQQCINISKMLIREYNIDYEKLELVHNLFGKYSECFESMTVLEDGNLLVSVKGIHIKVSSEDEFNNVYEVLIEENYHYFINNQRQDVIVDIGMNIGDSVLYFLQQEKVKKVYGFEPFKMTYLLAKENLKKYLGDKEKVEIFQYGISNKTEKRDIGFNQDMTCGQSTISSVRDFAQKKYEQIGLIKNENEINEQIKVCKASEVLESIIKKHRCNNLILKMDCEGEEYNIFEDLVDAELLDKFAFIMLEWHYQGKDMLTKYLKDEGFSYWCSDKSNEMGLIYAINTKFK